MHLAFFLLSALEASTLGHQLSPPGPTGRFLQVFNARPQSGRGPRFQGAMRQCFQEVVRGKSVPWLGRWAVRCHSGSGELRGLPKGLRLSEAEDWLGREASRPSEDPGGLLYRKQAMAKKMEPRTWRERSHWTLAELPTQRSQVLPLLSPGLALDSSQHPGEPGPALARGPICPAQPDPAWIPIFLVGE